MTKSRTKIFIFDLNLICMIKLKSSFLFKFKLYDQNKTLNYITFLLTLSLSIR